jgi:hypothetical protein
MTNDQFRRLKRQLDVITGLLLFIIFGSAAWYVIQTLGWFK